MRIQLLHARLPLSIGLTLCLLCVSAPGCATPRGALFPALEEPMVWPAAPETPRIKLIGAIAGSEDLHAGETALENFKAIIRGPRPAIRFSTPHGLAVHSDYLIAITDPGNAAVHILDLNERTHTLVGGWKEERFRTPVGAAWAGNRLFVSDGGRSELIELRADGTFVQRFGDQHLTRPVGVASVPTRDSLFIVDGAAHRLAEFRADGTFVRHIGAAGTETGSFNFPTHLCVFDQSMYVADSGNFRVQVLDFDGHVRHAYGKKGDAAGDFALPKGIAVDSQGHVYVVDAQFENVQVFTVDGQLLMAFGAEGRDLGRFWLPAGIAIDTLNRIWVADSGNRRVQVFQYLGSTS